MSTGAKRCHPVVDPLTTHPRGVAPAQAKGAANGVRCVSFEGLPFYYWYELQHAALGPIRAAADATRIYYKNPINPLTHTTIGKSIAAGCEMFERATRRYGKPDWNIPPIRIDGEHVGIHPQVVWERPFCKLVHFERALPDSYRPHPKVLIVAPMSGHYATLLRGTVEAFLPKHDVYITDWVDARMVPVGRQLRPRRLYRLRHLHPAYSAAMRTSSRCASLRSRCSPPSRSWRRATTPMRPIP